MSNVDVSDQEKNESLRTSVKPVQKGRYWLLVVRTEKNTYKFSDAASLTEFFSKLDELPIEIPNDPGILIDHGKLTEGEKL